VCNCHSSTRKQRLNITSEVMYGFRLVAFLSHITPIRVTVGCRCRPLNSRHVSAKHRSHNPPKERRTPKSSSHRSGIFSPALLQASWVRASRGYATPTWGDAWKGVGAPDLSGCKKISEHTHKANQRPNKFSAPGN